MEMRGGYLHAAFNRKSVRPYLKLFYGTVGRRI